ncbi:MAG: DUF3899 domain-containing protein [Candidatus Izemoplasmatales bacterium]|uniref:DUF3899 domain-containing protein n=1 Tax=Hujiaoplasma nucleasis TaxID=2725268 RepID=A0A7L6N105_9MOLU|nr:DUF3899 domain-containing protein [Hujiaoplasma nucleasis]QLY39936.1 DUF3899 domain-containing protein [Hujiaoplasma nucleasis]
MIKKYFIDLVVAGLLIFVLVQVLDDHKNLVQDTMFTVGVVMFSFGLLTASGATKMFRGMGYVLRKMFTKKVEGISYYEYLLLKEEKRDRVMGYPLLFSGITLVIVSIVLADFIERFSHMF